MTGTPNHPEYVQTRESPEGPYEAGSPTLSGTLRFPCCGETWEATSPKITHVRCPDCGAYYVFTLKVALQPAETPIWPGGVFVKVVKQFTAKVAPNLQTFPVGETYRVGSDHHGVLSLPKGHVILEVVVHKSSSLERIILATAPADHLELIEESDAQRTDTGSDQDGE
jgi:hypothetical protein